MGGCGVAAIVAVSAAIGGTKDLVLQGVVAGAPALVPIYRQ